MNPSLVDKGLVVWRDDFWATASAEQQNFVQHVCTILGQHGRAAMVVPDNVLLDGDAGRTVRRRLLAQAEVHALLRLPTGIFDAQREKANLDLFWLKDESLEAWANLPGH